VSSYGSDFNFDYHVSFTKEDLARGKVDYNYRLIDASIDELSGISVFYKDEAGELFHTYSTYARGAEELLSAYIFLDLTPRGRNETSPSHDLTDWVRHHDKYDDGGFVDPTGRYVPANASDSSCCSGEYDKAIHRRIQSEATATALVVESPTRSAAVTPRGTP
jgi:hypothetical protein